MIHDLSKKNSLVNQFLAEIRDVNIQKDRMRFRHNLERIGMIMAYEISKTIPFQEIEVETPLGIAEQLIPSQQPVIASIMRAALPLHNGVLSFFDKADNAFISAYRKHHKSGDFDIEIEYVSCPPINDRTLLVTDPMLATGASMVKSINKLLTLGTPSNIHIVVVIASSPGIDYVRRILPEAHIWVAAIDEELTARSYIVPGLGDAGDLAFGPKIQD